MTIQWTPEMDAALIELHARGASLKAIGERIGVGSSTARARAHAIGLRPHKQGQRIVWTPDMDAMLIDLRAQGFGYEEIGDRVGVANSTVKARVNTLGLPTWGSSGGRRHAQWVMQA